MIRECAASAVHLLPQAVLMIMIAYFAQVEVTMMFSQTTVLYNR